MKLRGVLYDLPEEHKFLIILLLLFLVFSVIIILACPEPLAAEHFVGDLRAFGHVLRGVPIENQVCVLDLDASLFDFGVVMIVSIAASAIAVSAVV